MLLPTGFEAHWTMLLGVIFPGAEIAKHLYYHLAIDELGQRRPLQLVLDNLGTAVCVQHLGGSAKSSAQ